MKTMMRYAVKGIKHNEEYSNSLARDLLDMGIDWEEFEVEEPEIIYLADYNEEKLKAFPDGHPEIARLLNKPNPWHIISAEDAEAIQEDAYFREDW